MRDFDFTKMVRTPYPGSPTVALALRGQLNCQLEDLPESASPPEVQAKIVIKVRMYAACWTQCSVKVIKGHLAIDIRHPPFSELSKLGMLRGATDLPSWFMNRDSGKLCCGTCNKPQDNLGKVLRHWSSTLKLSPVYRCVICQMQYPTKVALADHVTRSQCFRAIHKYRPELAMLLQLIELEHVYQETQDRIDPASPHVILHAMSVYHALDPVQVQAVVPLPYRVHTFEVWLQWSMDVLGHRDVTQIRNEIRT